jgi:8-oxo-dGTP pyrophosphatase MutT (NUDIX family)
MADAMPVQGAVSAGGVVWRRTADGTVEVALCGRRKERLWVLPKGTPNEGESLEETALREVREETGLETRLGPRLQSITYWFVARGVRFHKQVHYWLMEPTGGDTSLHDAEFDDVAWVPLGESLRMLSYPNERKVAAEAADALGAVV